MSKPHIIKITSLKGGVGKTTFAINFAITLQNFGYKVLLIDADWVNPNIGYYMGLDEPKSSARDILKNHASISHETGLDVIISKTSTRPFMPTQAEMFKFMQKLPKMNYDFIIIDIPHDMSLLDDKRLGKAEENLIMTTPDRIACSAALRLEAFYDRIGVHCEVIANRSNDKSHELLDSELPELFQGKHITSFPFDRNVQRGAARQTPVCIYSKHSKFSKRMRKFVLDYLDKKGYALPSHAKEARKGGGGIIAFLKSFFIGPSE